jgi:hypothetical protein
MRNHGNTSPATHFQSSGLNVFLNNGQEYDKIFINDPHYCLSNHNQGDENEFVLREF